MARLGVLSLLVSICARSAHGFMPGQLPWQSRGAAPQIRETLQHGRTLPARCGSSSALFAGPVVEARKKKAVDHVVIQDVVGHTVNCSVNAFINHEGKRYAVATPVDSVMLLMDSRGALVDPADEVVERMYNQLDNYFTDRGFEILHTAGFLTIAGEPDWAADEDIDDEEDTDDEGDGDDFLQDDEDEPEIEEGALRADPIVDVEFEGTMYRIAQLLDKVPLTAVETPEGSGDWMLVMDEPLHEMMTAAAEGGR